MHELSIMIEMVKQVEQVAQAQGVEKVEKIILQIGEISSVIPRFVEACFPAATYKTNLEGTALVIETIPANGLCKQCGSVHHLTEHGGKCPSCGSEDFELLTGREFILKEILVSGGDINE